MATKFYKCSHCGNVVEKVVDNKVPVFCCGLKMEELVPNTVEASGEKQICILANLAPRKIRGIESKGMILMARQNDGKMRFITPQETLANGAEIG